MDYPGGPNLITHALRSRELSLAGDGQEEVKEVVKGQIREIPSVRRVQHAVTISEM